MFFFSLFCQMEVFTSLMLNFFLEFELVAAVKELAISISLRTFQRAYLELGHRQCCFLCIWTLTSGAFLAKLQGKMSSTSKTRNFL